MDVVPEQLAFYVTGGTIPPGSPSYVSRAADSELLAALQHGELCYVLNARQMGKSSLSVRTRQALESAGTRTAFLDLQKFGSSATPEQWYRALLERVGSDLKLRSDFLAYWRDNAEMPPLARLFGALREVALETISGNLVVFLDEIDVIRDLRFPTDEFFGAIRETHNARVTDPAYDRLTFCLIGTVAPTDLIRDVRLSPFNIGTRLKLADLTREEAAPLAGPLPGGSKTLDRVYAWTYGHPYLTQRLCAELSRAGSTDVDAMVSRLFFARSDADVDENIKNVRNGILRAGNSGDSDTKGDTTVADAGFDRTDLLTRYGLIVAGKRVPDDDTDGVSAALRLSGLVTARDGFLHVRNRVYAHLFDAAWVRANLPDAEVRRQRAAVAKARWQVGSIAAAVLLLMAGLLWRTGKAEQRANREASLANREAALATAQASAANHLSYISAINVASQDIESGNYGVAQQFLHDAAQFPHSERGYEWDYLQERLHPELLTLTGYMSPVNAVAYSPDGKRIVTGSYDYTARVWDAATGKELLTLKGPASVVNTVAFSPDGRRIATGNFDNTTHIWDAATGRELLTLKGPVSSVLLIGDVQGIRSVTFSPDGKRLATGSADNTARLWDATTGKELLTLKGSTAVVNAVAFSPDGKRLATGSVDKAARLWDVATGRELITFTGHTDDVWSVAFSPDGKRLATGSADNTARLWDVATAKEIVTLKGHTAAVFSVTFSPDGKHLATGSRDNTARLWDTATGQELLTFKGAINGVYSVAFSPVGKRLATGNGDGTVRLWDATPTHDITTLKGHINDVYSVAFSPDGKCLASGSGDGTVRLWDVATAREQFTLKGQADAVYSVAFSPDGKRIATGGSDSKVHLWDIAAGRELFTLKGATSFVNTVAFSPDGKRIATGSHDKTVRIWDAASGKELLALKGSKSAVYSLAFSPDSKRLATGSGEFGANGDNTARLWDVATGHELFTLKGHTAFVASIAFSPDGKYLATASFDSTARVWNTLTGKEIVELKGHTGAIMSIAFSPDGKRIATGSFDNTARLWDAATGREMLTFTANRIFSVAFSPDGRYLCTGSGDKIVRLWRKPTPRQQGSMDSQDADAARLAALSRLSIADAYHAARNLAERRPGLRLSIAIAINDIAWNLVDPQKPKPTATVAHQALQVAAFALELSDRKNGNILDTLAAAQFACGALDSALTSERQAVALLPMNQHLADALKRYESLAPARGKTDKAGKATP